MFTRRQKASSFAPGTKGPALQSQVLRQQLRNDLDMIIATIELAATQADAPEARAYLLDTVNRVGLVAASGSSFAEEGSCADLESELSRTCMRLNTLCDRVRVGLEVDGRIPPISADGTMAAVVVVNELVSNAVRHAFRNTDRLGLVRIRLFATKRHVHVAVEDDGCALGIDGLRASHAFGGLQLACKLVEDKGGTLLLPGEGSKRFELRFTRAPELVVVE